MDMADLGTSCRPLATIDAPPRKVRAEGNPTLVMMVMSTEAVAVAAASLGTEASTLSDMFKLLICMKMSSFSTANSSASCRSRIVKKKLILVAGDSNYLLLRPASKS